MTRNRARLFVWFTALFLVAVCAAWAVLVQVLVPNICEISGPLPPNAGPVTCDDRPVHEDYDEILPGYHG